MEKKQNKSDMSKKIKPLADRVLIKEEDFRLGLLGALAVFIEFRCQPGWENGFFHFEAGKEAAYILENAVGFLRGQF